MKRTVYLTGRVAVVLFISLGLSAIEDAGAEPKIGAILDQSSADEASGLLPPEVEAHYRKGEYMNRVVAFPDSRWSWDDGFMVATSQNGQRLVLDEHKSPVDKTTGRRPDYIEGLPFPIIQEDDPDAGAKIIWNLTYAYYTGGNSHNLTVLDWLSRGGLERQSIQDVYFLYYDGQPRKYSPPSNPQNLLYQLLAVSQSPADLQGTAALSYRFKDPAKRDLSWAYLPALRRVRAVSPANRSDGFLGSDQSQDDGFFFDGKPEDFDWKVVGHREQMRFVDPDSITDRVVQRELPGGGWRTKLTNNDRTVGFMVKDWKGVPWAPVAGALAKRKFWVVAGVPRDRYYLYGRLELWIDDFTWQGAWNRKSSWQGELLNLYAVMGFATHAFNDTERWWGSTMGLQLSENVKADRATVSGLSAPGEDPPNDRRIPLEPAQFDYQSLFRLGK